MCTTQALAGASNAHAHSALGAAAAPLISTDLRTSSLAVPLREKRRATRLLTIRYCAPRVVSHVPANAGPCQIPTTQKA
jgi:hypothetical protein